MEFFPEVHLTDTDAEMIARGLMGVARADGKVLEREALMIKMFLADASSDDTARIQSLENETAIDPKVLAQGLSGPDIATLFLKSCFLVAYADGHCAASERKLIESYADAIEFTRDDLAKLDASVKEYLLGQLNHVNNVDAVAEVARELKL